MRSIGAAAFSPGSMFLYLVTGPGGVAGFVATLLALAHVAPSAAATISPDSIPFIDHLPGPSTRCPLSLRDSSSSDFARRAHGSAAISKLGRPGRAVISGSTWIGTGFQYRFFMAPMLVAMLR